MAGVCPIKKEYIAAQVGVNVDNGNNEDAAENENMQERKSTDFKDCPSPSKRAKPEEFLVGKDDVKKKEGKIKLSGQNKSRPRTFVEDKEKIPCPTIVDVRENEEPKKCQYLNCKFIHDPVEYLKIKPKDIDKDCYNFFIRGLCERGLACRFGGSHITEDGKNIFIPSKNMLQHEKTLNALTHELQVKLQKRKYDFSLSENIIKANDLRKKQAAINIKNGKTDDTIEDSKKVDDISPSTPNTEEADTTTVQVTSAEPQALSLPDATKVTCGVVTDEDIVSLLPREKKKINWKDKLYLSPLTTVGNLPFRRICTDMGADITCGEMVLCESLLKGMKQEWALAKRHSTEKQFGVQICGSNVYLITKAAQLLQDTTEVDFVELNLGCPIELVYRKGGGCGMLHRIPTLEASIRCASNILSVPFNVKMRTGVYQDKWIAHTLTPRIAEWGASLITLHGRSREQRYTRFADWDYIEKCAQACAPCPVFGNGDIMGYDDYIHRREQAPTVQGVMIGRGALIKPWVFQEIKEQKLIDISSCERFDILKKYTNYGLEHWGSDTRGVENTRRFLLEWLSFLYRYVPVGILEKPPQRINERPPIYVGRDDLETLMASNNCADWIKISEMLLGPVPENFQFLPKHKANSYK